MTTFYIGLMSGTSVDSIDAVLLSIDNTSPRLHSSHRHPIPPALQQQTLALFVPGENELERMSQLDVRFGQLFADAVNALLKASNISTQQITAIGSHGQTLRHYPDNEFPNTLQIGDPNIIAELTGITTVADFRRRDMAAGGQGAPLVPAFHQALLQSDKINRVILNIGGIANITVLASDTGKTVTGFDTGPGNALMDAWILSQQQQPHDNNGAWAASGRVHQALLEQLLADAYFQQPPPKSTGRESFNLNWLERILLQFPKYSPKPSAEDIQATLTELSAISIAQAILQYATESEQVLVCGGGVHNDYLMQRIRHHLPEQQLNSTLQAGIDPDWVEAMAFAWLAKQTLDGRAGNLPGVTGATHPVILGGIYS
ncbi:Anhydro-N-acetylmuramic acid kinase [hydrothermal vent metagenome]|uniref:Anhydro-N-acetylmuramic acid kinase n=1 Tax=hydrothermal vent metagenome TaxID=652676 RepID=A0A3B1BS68_9ZZZZ